MNKNPEQSPVRQRGDEYSAPPIANEYSFLDFTFFSKTLELRRNGAAIPLKTQPARLLLILLEHAPNVVPRGRLQELIWDNGTQVEFEQGLNVCVSQLRTALGDSATEPRCLQTLPKRGYRFVAPVRRRGPTAAHRRRSLAAGIGATIALAVAALFISRGFDGTAARVYVAPVEFVGTLSAEQRDLLQYALRFATLDQLAKSDVTTLRALRGESAYSIDTSAWFRGAADYRLLSRLEGVKAEVALEARLLRSTDSKEVARQIFHASDISATSLGKLSGDLANWVRHELGIAAESPAPRARMVTQSPAFYQAMLRARYAFQLGDPIRLSESLEWYDRALAEDPASADALGGKAVTLAVIAGSTLYPSETTYAESLAVAERLRDAIGPTVETELARGYVYLYRDWEIDAALKAFDAAVELSPGHALVHAWRAAALAAKGEIARAATEVDLAVALDPLSMAIVSDRCWYLGAAGRYAEAVADCEWVLELDADHYWARMGLAVAQAKLGARIAAHQVLAPMLESLRAGNAALPDAFVMPVGADDLREAHCELAAHLRTRAENFTFPYSELAALSALCGEFSKVPALLQSARNAGESGALFFAVDPRLAEFRASAEAGSLDFGVAPRAVDSMSQRR